MYVDNCSTGKYIRHLLRECYRENGKIKHRTIANLSHCSPEEIEAIRLALRHKEDLGQLGSITDAVSLQQGLSVGALWLVYDLSRQLGIVDALGSSRQGKLALWQVIARVLDQGSRLSAVRLASAHAACDVLGLAGFNEDDLYGNLDWLCENQVGIETSLFQSLQSDRSPQLFLYDVTSCYLEGSCNEFAAFGYNRDGKRGKRQIVIGLLCNEAGKPLSVEVFPGNTQDPSTFASQVRKVSERFGGGDVTFVGDRGMIKSQQVEDLTDHGFHYITALTRPQMETLLVKGVLQMDLFEQNLAEIETDEGVRYIFRRNPLRAKEIARTRQEKLSVLERALQKQNQYLAEHALARADVALRNLLKRCEQLKVAQWVRFSSSGRELSMQVDEEVLSEVSKLDGCYVLKCDLGKAAVSKEVIHARYKDLALVEWAFRTSKTVQLELRPVHVRLESHTRAHVFVVMLAYRIVQELAQRWKDFDLTVEEGIQELATLCSTELVVNGTPRCNQIPEPRPSCQRLLAAARVRLPQALPCSGVHVTTRKKLTKNRKTR